MRRLVLCEKIVICADSEKFTDRVEGLWRQIMENCKVMLMANWKKFNVDSPIYRSKSAFSF